MTPALEVRALSFRYPGGPPVLREVSFALAPGEAVALVGPNGSGKSTLLQHLNGILPERLGDQAAIHVDGRPLVAAHLAEIRRRVGLLFQDPDDQLFCGTVREDVAFGPAQLGLAPAEIAARVERALAEVGATALADRAPHHLSTGEKRRVCLAGVLACEPSILVLDEPTSGLDPRGRRELLRLLRTLPATKLVATHDLEFAVELCPRTLLLDGGTIVAAGPTATLLGDEPLMLAHGLERPHVLTHRHPHH